MSNEQDHVLSIWENPVNFSYRDAGDDSIKAVLEPNIDALIRNLSQLRQKAEEDWYLELVISVLESKGYVVTKEPNENAH